MELNDEENEIISHSSHIHNSTACRTALNHQLEHGVNNIVCGHGEISNQTHTFFDLFLSFYLFHSASLTLSLSW